MAGTSPAMTEGDSSRLASTGSLEQRDVDHVEPAQDAMDDRPEDRVVVGIGDRDGECRAEAHAVFRALDPNSIVSIFVHGDPSNATGADWCLVRRSAKAEA